MEPITWIVLAPFVGILIGVVLRTFYPLYVARLQAIQNGEPAPPFDKQYLFPPLATIGLDIGAFAFALLTEAGYLEQIQTLALIPAILVGYGLQEVVRDLQKIGQALRKRL